MNFLNILLNIIFPTKCVSCKKDNEILCKKCLLNSPTAERESAGWIFPIFDYRHMPIKKSIWLLKYKGEKRLASIFAELIYEKMIEELSELSVLNNFNNIILIPIPLYKSRYKERGYNQTELLCEEIIKINNIRHGVNMQLEKNILIKTKETEHQANIRERNRRLKNLSGSFSMKNENLIKERNIILIDDVTTTGTTLKEAKNILKKFGAKKIIAFTIAH